jgi:hypothetical protein
MKGETAVGDHLLFLVTPSQMPVASLFRFSSVQEGGMAQPALLMTRTAEVHLNMAGSLMLLQERNQRIGASS